MAWSLRRNLPKGVPYIPEIWPVTHMVRLSQRVGFVVLCLFLTTCTGDQGINPPVPTSLAFVEHPTDAVAGAVLAPAVEVEVLDADGIRVVDWVGAVTIVLDANPGGTLAGTTTVAVEDGVASFADLSIDAAHTGYTLKASATDLDPVTSDPFTIAPGPATELAFTQQPLTVTVGAVLSPAVKVTAQDALGNAVTDFTDNVTVAISGNPGATLSGTTTLAAVAGVATFSDLRLDMVGVGYTFTASSGSLTAGTSAAFTVASGAATQLVFTEQPSTAPAGTVIAPVVRVTAQDAFGNVNTSFTGNVTVAIGTNPSGGALFGTVTVAAIGGVATFSTLSIDQIGVGYTLTANSGSLTPGTSTAFNIVASAATQLEFSVPPSTTIAGEMIAPDVEVTAKDALGNTDPTFTGDVTIAIASNPASGTLSGTVTIAAVAGVATFSTLSIEKASAGYTLTATSGALTAATSAAFTISPGAVAQLAFTVNPPVTLTAGQAMSPSLQVSAQDVLGNLTPTFTGPVTVALGANPGAGTLSGITTVAAVAGVATFPTLSIDKAGVGYTLTANSGTLTEGTSTPFTITPGAATQLVFTVQPSNAVVGAAIAPAIEVSAQDALGNTNPTFTSNVTVAIGTNPGAGILSGTTTVAAVGGVATFSTLSIDKAGAGYTLTASSGALTAGTSAAFAISAGAATKLTFTVQPVTTVAGQAITPAVQVSAQDALGNTDVTFTGPVTVAIETNPASGSLAGTVTVGAVAGVATFSNLSIDKAGIGYTLTTNSGALTAATSAAFTINPGAATRLTFTVQPVTTVAGQAITPAVQVSAQDALGNTNPTFTGNVTVAIGTNPSAGILSGTTTVAAVAGVATFSNLSIDKAGIGYTLGATSGALTAGTSTAFTISAGAATKLTFTVQPVATIAGQAITPAVKVSAQDVLGNTNPTFTGNVTVAIGTNPSAGILSGTTTVAAVAGVATFSNLGIDKAGIGYTLGATSGVLTAGTSGAFTISAGVATQLVFTVEPSTAAVGVMITPAVRVSAQDALGNTNATFTGNVTVAIGTNPSAGILSGTTTVAAVAGVATFSNLSIDKIGVGYTLTANSGVLTAATSAAFTISAGAPSQLVFTVPPATTTVGATISPAVKVTAQDAVGNTVTTFAGNVTVAIGTNPGTATLAGTRTMAAVGGVATFSNLSINQVGAGYTLTATTTGVPLGTSAAFDIIPSEATVLVFTVSPARTTAGAIITPAVQVVARDASGQLVTSFTGSVTVAISSGTSGATLSGTTTVTAAGGTASFSDLSIDKSGSTYRLTATSAGLTDGTSGFFTIDPGPVAQLAYTVGPSDAAAGLSITPQIEVTARDVLGNVATGFTSSVSLAITSGTGTAGAALSGVNPKFAVAGVATFPAMSINLAGTGYTLTASSGALLVASDPFDITAGAGNHLVYTQGPSATVAGATMTPAVTVTMLDAANAVLTTFTGPVTVSITAGTGTSGAVLSGTKTVNAVDGVANFNDLSINKSGTGYRLSVVADGAAGATSGTFVITAGATTALDFTVHPASTTAGATMALVTVTAVDAQGNRAASFSGNVTLAITTNPGGGTLSGTVTVAAAAGIANFTNLSIDKSGTGYRLGASATGLASDVSNAFSITGGTATRLIFTVQPSNATAGANITPSVRVAALDALDNVATGFTGNVTLAIATNPAGGVLSGSTTVAAVSGVAIFTPLSINNPGVGYTLNATAASLTGGTSVAFNIN